MNVFMVNQKQNIKPNSGQQVAQTSIIMNVFGQPETKLFNEIKFNSPQQQQQPRQDTYNDIRPDILEMIKVI